MLKNVSSFSFFFLSCALLDINIPSFCAKIRELPYVARRSRIKKKKFCKNHARSCWPRRVRPTRQVPCRTGEPSSMRILWSRMCSKRIPRPAMATFCTSLATLYADGRVFSIETWQMLVVLLCCFLAWKLLHYITSNITLEIASTRIDACTTSANSQRIHSTALR